MKSKFKFIFFTLLSFLPGSILGKSLEFPASDVDINSHPNADNQTTGGGGGSSCICAPTFKEKK